MLGARTGGARTEVSRCIDASLRCQSSCEQGMARLRAQGLPADDEAFRLLRQCAELCELNVRALQKESRLSRRTASLCFELGSQVARAAWLEAQDAASHELARDALHLARACRPLVFAA
ncbi:hypothetical protein [Corallococcus llansteffanensis]|uniref:Uncharacterized protein n=1 Tax=Corallococcus llansteffanensis TaxID=2316731 RepID=A0A3A8PXH8_9BACT|nr:hypothetical protein [Corallococcus llansteffanensis]RKH56094.1 hypothetical protein D7V93_21015 [Corallococcus llansteffanensis]